MTIPDASLDVVGRCPRDRATLDFQGDTWACPVCDTLWDHDGTNGRSARLPARPPSILDRPTDSTSPSVLDQPQPD